MTGHQLYIAVMLHICFLKALLQTYNIAYAVSVDAIILLNPNVKAKGQ